MKEDRCVVCGDIIPEGRMVCTPCSREDCDRNTPVIETVVVINTVGKVKKFCSLCSKCKGDVLVFSDKYIVSGKSPMGIYSLDLSKPLKVEFHGDIPDDVKEGMKKFITRSCI